MIVQHLQAMILPLVMRGTHEASGVAQRYNPVTQDPQEEAMLPSIHAMKEGEESSRGWDISGRGPGTTISSHVIRNVQEKTREVQRQRTVLQRPQARVLLRLDVSIEEAKERSRWQHGIS